MKITSKNKCDKEYNFTAENALISRSEQGMGLPAITHVEIGHSLIVPQVFIKSKQRSM